MLFVSCQPYKNEEYYTKDFILNMAYAAKLGGAKGLRIEGINNITYYLKKKIDLPVIGLIKREIKDRDRYISPTEEDINKIIKTGCKYVAIDFTIRDNLNEEYYKKITELVHKNSNCKLVADISNIEEAKMAKNCGADFISTALRGYTSYTKNIKLPDINFIKQLKVEGIDNIIAEGGYSTHSNYSQALTNGAKIIVIGTAITRPHLIVKKIISGSY